MPSKPASGDDRLEQALASLTRALDATRVPWMIIGGIAAIARGVRRMTTDIDAAVRGDRVDVAALAKALSKKRIVPRISDAVQFANESLVLLVKHEPTGVELDITMAWTDFEHEAIEEASLAAFGAVSAPMARAEDLVVFKVIAARPKDMEDAKTLLVLYPRTNRERIRARVRELAVLSEQPDLARGLEAIITASDGGRARPQEPDVSRARGKTRRPKAKPRTAGKARR